MNSNKNIVKKYNKCKNSGTRDYFKKRLIK